MTCLRRPSTCKETRRWKTSWNCSPPSGREIKHAGETLVAIFAGLLRQAQYDSLTGQRRLGSTLTRLQQEVSRAQRYGPPLCVAMLDIDHFKQCNTTYLSCQEKIPPRHPGCKQHAWGVSSLLCSLFARFQHFAQACHRWRWPPC